MRGTGTESRVWRQKALTLVLALAVVASNETSMLPKCPPPPAECACGEWNSAENEYFCNVSGKTFIFKYKDGFFYGISCQNAIALEDPGLPRFVNTVRVKKVKFEKCAPPRNKSYATALAELNVTKYSELLLNLLPRSVVRREHFAGLRELTSLELQGAVMVDVRLEPGALSAMPYLQHLSLHRVRTTAADLAHLPPSLYSLKLWHVGADQSMWPYLGRLPNLTDLNVSEKYANALNVSNYTALKVLSISTSDTVVPDDVLPQTLTKLTLGRWNDKRPSPMKFCAHLEQLKVTGTNKLEWPLSLPDECVARCGRLRTLEMYYVPVNEILPARLLAQARELRNLTIKYCHLSTLPLGLLYDTKHLTLLDLSHNKLFLLPSGLFLFTQSLTTLILSHNQLRHWVAESLSAVTSLHTLHLSDNPQLGDLCSGGSASISVPVGYSPLRRLRSLSYLYIVTRV